MKKLLLFGSGFIAGIIATILVLTLIVENQPNDGMNGLTIFPEKGDCITTKSEIEVFQVLQPNMALAHTAEFPDGIVVLLINYDGKSYYDDQRIKIPTTQRGQTYTFDSLILFTHNRARNAVTGAYHGQTFEDRISGSFLSCNIQG